MGKITINPNAKQPEFVAVQPGEYRMRFQRLDDKAIGQSEKGNWWARMRLVHAAPADQLVSLTTGLALGAEEMPGSVSAIFMLTGESRDQGKIRQAVESTGQAWPTSSPEFADEESFAQWIWQMLDGRECVVRLKTRQYEGEWSNDVARYVTGV